MSTNLTAYSGVQDPLQFVKEMGQAIAASQMFGCENASQGQVLALSCLANQCDPLSLPLSYHLMHGRLVVRADEALARLVRAGGSYEIVAKSSEVATIRVSLGSRTYTETLTHDDCKGEPFYYSGKPAEIMPKLLAGKSNELKISTNYATPRRRMQHLWARVCTDAVRTVAPQLVAGRYSPQETAQYLVDDGKIAPAKAQELLERVEPVAAGENEIVVEFGQPEAPASNVQYGNVEEVETVEITEDPSKASGPQIARLTELFKALKVPGDKQLDAMKKRGATDMGDLSREAATDLITALESRLDKSRLNPEATVGTVDGPASQAQIDRITAKLREAAQLDENSPAKHNGAGLGARVKAKLQECGLVGLASLSSNEADQIEAWLCNANLAAFFTASFSGHEKKAQEGNGQ